MSYITTTYETTDEDGTVTSSIDLRIHYTFHKGCPATMYLCNGDPGNPAEPDGIEYVRAEYQVIGKWFPCLDVLSDWAALWVEENTDLIMADVSAEREDAAEWRAQAARDDMLMEKFNG